MKKYLHLACGALAVVGLGSIHAQAVNLLSSGDFEATDGEVPGWTLAQFATGSGTILNSAEVVDWADVAQSGIHSLWLRAFEGGEEFGDDNLTNAILSQTVAGVVGETYTFSGHVAFENNYSGAADALVALTGGPLSGQPSPTQTNFELAFLDAGGSPIGTPLTVELGPIVNTFRIWEQHSLVGQAPAGTANVRVTALARDMVFNADPGQSAFFDSFSLTGESDPAAERLVNADLEELPSFGLEDWTITIDDPADPPSDEIIRAVGFANHTPGGATGIWLSSFLGEPGTEVDGILSQTVPGEEGGDYIFSGWSRWETDFSGGLDGFPTETYMELAFLDGSDTVIGSPIMLDLATEQTNDGEWRQHTLTGVAPTGTTSVRISAGMIDGVDSGANPQSAFFDDFFLELASSLPGDFDGDGNVDGDDFLVWQQGFGTLYDGNDFLIWQQNFGSGSGSGGGSIPEPASTALVLLAVCLVGTATRPRR